MPGRALSMQAGDEIHERKPGNTGERILESKEIVLRLDLAALQRDVLKEKESDQIRAGDGKGGRGVE